MSVNRIDDLVSRAQAAAKTLGDAKPEDRKAQLASIAAEFESMLMGQMLGAMRQSAKWGGEEDEKDGFGGQAFFEMIDTELVQKLARNGGLGLGAELQRDLDRSFGQGGANPTLSPLASPLPPAAGPASVDPQAVAKQVTSAYGWRADPIEGQARFHKGIDLAAAYGDDVRSAAPGRVVFSGEQRGYGNTVVVEHAGGVRSRYAHLASADVQAGVVIAAGQTIGRAGSTGRSTGPHVHFEVTVGDQSVDPQSWLQGLSAGFKPGPRGADLPKGRSIDVGAQE